MVQLSTVI